MGKLPERFGIGRVDRNSWPGIAAGLAGLGLLGVVELAMGPAASQPVIRYQPHPPEPMAVAATPEVAFMVVPKVSDLESAFRDAGYDLNAVRKFNKPVPRLRLAILPSGMTQIKNPKRRKELFLALVLPMVLEANAHIAAERRRLVLVAETIKAKQPLPSDVQHWLERLAERYKTKPHRLDELLRRVDTIPVSLALAQAAIESGWGTSRFATEGNAFFGQWTTAAGRGMVPSDRPEGMTHKVRSFSRLSDSVEAYLLNLNTHRAYRGLRAMREEVRSAGKQPTGIYLAASLQSYSEKGEEYVELLRGIIRVNRLSPFNRAILSDEIIYFNKGS